MIIHTLPIVFHTLLGSFVCQGGGDFITMGGGMVMSAPLLERVVSKCPGKLVCAPYTNAPPLRLFVPSCGISSAARAAFFPLLIDLMFIDKSECKCYSPNDPDDMRVCT